MLKVLTSSPAVFPYVGYWFREIGNAFRTVFLQLNRASPTFNGKFQATLTLRREIRRESKIIERCRPFAKEANTGHFLEGPTGALPKLLIESSRSTGQQQPSAAPDKL